MRIINNVFLVLSIVGLLFSGCVNAQTKEKTKTVTTTAATAKVISLNKADFIKKVYDFEKNPQKWTYEGDKPCIIDFYATWCGPCRKVAPILEELAKTYKDKIVIYKIDVDKESSLANAFGIQSIPTLLFVPSNGIPRLSQGALSKEDFVDQIENFLLEKKK